MSVFARLSPRLQAAIVARLGWTALRPVQELSGEALLAGHNAIVLAPTAGGKTEAAMFPVLSMMLDEPPSGLDPFAGGDFDALIRTLQQTLGLTVFMVTHDLESLHTVCDRIAALADGKVVAVGPMADMLASEHPWVKSYFRGKRARLLQRRLAQPVT